MTDIGKIIDLETTSAELVTRDVLAAWVIVAALVAMLHVGGSVW